MPLLHSELPDLLGALQEGRPKRPRATFVAIIQALCRLQEFKKQPRKGFISEAARISTKALDELLVMGIRLREAGWQSTTPPVYALFDQRNCNPILDGPTRCSMQRRDEACARRPMTLSSTDSPT